MRIGKGDYEAKGMDGAVYGVNYVNEDLHNSTIG